jgi:hypothetical protein
MSRYSQEMESVVDHPGMHIAVTVALILLPGFAIFLWGRGIRRSCLADMIAGLAILPTMFAVLFWRTEGSCAALRAMSLPLLAFGLTTWVLSYGIKPGGPLKRGEIEAFGGFAFALGMACSLIL